MRRQKNDMQILLIPGAIVAVAVFLFLVISANSSQLSSSTGTNATSSQAATLPVNPAPPVVPQSEATPVTAPEAPVQPIQATQPTAPAPEALKLLLPSEIASAKPQDNGYLVTTTFGAIWLFSQQDVETLPMSMKLRIDYGKYGAGSHGAERGS
jgi:hypothetical protein